MVNRNAFLLADCFEADRFDRKGKVMRRLIVSATILWIAGGAPAALANNVGENHAWQFETSADKVNKAAIADMIEKKASGYYAPPVYNTTIERQFNCSVASTATGNQGSNTNLANSPTTSGPVADATGNDNQTDIDGWGTDGDATSEQDNSGDVAADVDGDVASRVSGSPEQALNSEQGNTGDQTASVDGSTACNFANVLN
jgi:hypothetical protein